MPYLTEQRLRSYHGSKKGRRRWKPDLRIFGAMLVIAGCAAVSFAINVATLDMLNDPAPAASRPALSAEQISKLVQLAQASPEAKAVSADPASRP